MVGASCVSLLMWIPLSLTFLSSTSSGEPLMIDTVANWDLPRMKRLAVARAMYFCIQRLQIQSPQSPIVIQFMGNKNTNKLEELDHPRLGHVKLSDTSDHRTIQHSFPIKSTSEGETFQADVDKLSGLDSKYLFLPESIKLEKAGLCGSSGYARASYPLYEYSLQKEIAERKSNDLDFKEKQIIFLLNVLASAGKAFEPSAGKIGDIRPKNILMNERGEVKIFCSASAPGENTGLFKAYQNAEKAYLSPEELMELSKNNAFPININNSKSEVFSAGITALQCGTKGDVQGLYNLSTFKLNTQKIDDLKAEFKQKYSPLLSYLVSKMVEQEPVDRPYFSQIFSLLEPYRLDIQDKRDVTLHPQTAFESINKHYSIPNTLNSHVFDTLINDLQPQTQSVPLQKAPTKVMHGLAHHHNFQPPPTFKPTQLISQPITTSIPRPISVPAQRRTLLQDIVPASKISQSIYQPIYTTNTKVIRGNSNIPQIKFNYQSRQ